MRWIFFCTMNSLEITLPHSKSILIRYLISHYVNHREILPLCEEESNDVKIVQRALGRLHSHRGCVTPCAIEVEDCGAAFRFLCAVAAATPGNWILCGAPRLLKRPIAPLIQSLKQAGFSLHPTEKGIEIKGETRLVQEMEIDCQESSQFGSALHLAAPLMGNPQIHTYPEQISSAGYLQMSRQIAQKVAGQKTAPNIERDWSAALFWYAHLLLHPQRKITLKGLFPHSLQPDSVIAEWFSEWGISTQFHTEGITLTCVPPQQIPPQQIDISNNIDTAPILAVLALLYPFTLTLTGTRNLNKKESQRQEILISTLSQFTNIKDITEDSFTICKREKALPQTLTLSSYNDHRFVLAWSLFQGFSEVQIDHIESVTKSYPNFLSDLEKTTKTSQK